MKYLADIEDTKLYSLDELETFFREKNIPQDKIRFFVNVNSDEPRCFGIYQDKDTGEYIVYKNKNDGSRYIRYQGNDEKQAVEIFFDKLKDEMAIRDGKPNNKVTNNRGSNKILIGIVTFFILIGVAGIIVGLLTGDFKKNGYYYYNNETYYYQAGDFYYYDDALDDWLLYEGIIDDEYYINDYDTNDIEPFEDSEYYDNEYSDDDFDNYDYDSWDSSDTDWGSDW